MESHAYLFLRSDDFRRDDGLVRRSCSPCESKLTFGVYSGVAGEILRCPAVDIVAEVLIERQSNSAASGSEILGGSITLVVRGAVRTYPNLIRRSSIEAGEGCAQFGREGCFRPIGVTTIQTISILILGLTLTGSMPSESSTLGGDGFFRNSQKSRLIAREVGFERYFLRYTLFGVGAE